MSDKIRVLIVDDSAFMRKAIQMMLTDDPMIEIVGFASNGQEGVDKTFELKPDLVTMDIEMPLLDGLTALRMIMEKQPTPVIMVSSLSSEGAQITLDALDLGAVDFIAKQMSFVSLDIVKIKADLQAKIRHIHSRRRTLMAQYSLRKGRQIAQTVVGGARTSQTSALRAPRKKQKLVRLVSIGTSTGGPPALQAVLTSLPRNFPVGIVIVQHMPPMFTKSLAERLNNLCQITVKEAEDGEQINPGTAYVAPGDRHLLVRKNLSSNVAVLSEKPADTLHRPSVDVLMNSVAEAVGQISLGVIMTGMGADGLQGLRAMKNRGADIIAQNEESCIVYGMPRAVIEAGLANTIAPLEQIAGEIMAYF
jgi:two-component system, chemotaxis family, protein-glutamate methylesterase/glutaminase